MIPIWLIFLFKSSTLFALSSKKIASLFFVLPHLLLGFSSGLTCNNNQELFELQLKTDPWGYETEWEIKQNAGKIIASGGNKDGSSGALRGNTQYNKQICLDKGSYTFKIMDAFGDGLADCSRYNCGNYKIFLDGDRIASGEGNNFRWSVFHQFSVEGSRGNSSCPGNQKSLQITVKTDRYPEDTSWFLADKSNKQYLHSVSPNEYGKHEISVENFCLRPDRDYQFTIKDKVGDGLCCQHGKGFYKVALDGEELFSGGNTMGKEETTIITTKKPQMSQRDKQYLDAHNKRRKEWHEKNGVSYVPLKWSNELAKDAKVWAESLKSNCGSGVFHEKNVDEGENISRNFGSGSWGKLPDPDRVVWRFVEREANWDWPKNSHLTQVLWRPTKYVGCAESFRDMGNGRKCHTQVCRYAKPGNCNMKQHDTWLEAMLQDDSPCGKPCPDDGCY